MRIAVDTSALLALASVRDQYHRRARATAERVRALGGRWVGSTLVLAELHGHLIQYTEPPRARAITAAVLADPAFEWHDVSPALLQSAIDRWIVKFSDQRFSLTDATTFELMRRERISAAFAFDQHFITAGYTLLGSDERSL